jgi:outer membrane lipoprotein-sorting protein
MFSPNHPWPRRAFLLALGAAPLALSRPAFGATAELLKQLAEARGKLKTLIAPFEQTRVIGLLAEPVKSKGELTLVRPDQLRWELFAPDDVVYWVNKGGVAYRAGKGKPTSVPKKGGFTAVLDDLMVFLAGDLSTLSSRYDISATSESNQAISIVATPKVDELKKHLKKIAMRTNAERWGIASVDIEDATGDTSAIVFSANERDKKVDPARMKPS